MRKLTLPWKTCPECGAIFNRYRLPSGVLESPRDYAKRTRCFGACSRGRARRPVTKPNGRCLHCQESLIRSRYGNGAFEPLPQFRRRKWCSREHMRAWMENPWNRMQYRRWIEAGRRKAGIVPGIVCFHGERSLRRCSMCREIARSLRVSGRTLMRPRSEWRELWAA